MQSIKATSYDATPTGLSADDLTAYYSSFHTVGLAGQCQLLKKRIEHLKSIIHGNVDYWETNTQLHDARRRLRIARQVLANRQLSLF
jgi:hypothetical protein